MAEYYLERYEDAERDFHQALREGLALESALVVHVCLMGCAALLAGRGIVSSAAILGAAAALRDASGVKLQAIEMPLYERSVDAIHAVADPESYPQGREAAGRREQDG